MSMDCNYKECPDNIRGVCRHNIFCISDQEEIISLSKKLAEKENPELDSFTNPRQGMGGYQPDGHTKLNPNNPPKGGSGVPSKVNSGHFSNVMSNEMALSADIVEFVKSNYINALTRDLFGVKLDEEIQKAWVIFKQTK